MQYFDDGTSEWLDLAQHRHLLVQGGGGAAPRGREAVARSVLVYWPGEEAYFEGVITDFQGHG